MLFTSYKWFKGKRQRYSGWLIACDYRCIQNSFNASVCSIFWYMCVCVLWSCVVHMETACYISITTIITVIHVRGFNICGHVCVKTVQKQTELVLIAKTYKASSLYTISWVKSYGLKYEPISSSLIKRGNVSVICLVFDIQFGPIPMNTKN